MCFSCQFDHIGLWHVGRVIGERWGRTWGEEGVRDVGSPVARSEVQGCKFVTCLVWHAIFLGVRKPPLCPNLLSLFSVTLYLLLIGFNERFNKTALPDQIKLLLSAMLNPGSLLCNASTALPAGLLQTCFRPLHSLQPPPSSCPVLLMSLLSNPQQAETAHHTRKVPTGAAAMHSASHLFRSKPK